MTQSCDRSEASAHAEEDVTIDLDVLSVAAGDDPFATRRATDRTLGHLHRARVERRLIDPGSCGLGPIGHLWLFRGSAVRGSAVRGQRTGRSGGSMSQMTIAASPSWSPPVAA
ncbi:MULTISPECIES: hypothetical protein [unclassified Streptomyces]|uniref:hypothetical protein n=1 Tax=unclassified Streptomyces TaxID=2593676 RepID=UPI000CD4ECBF|nr:MULTISPECIES: hypothetical protein [unclassified Streptomyces]